MCRPVCQGETGESYFANRRSHCARTDTGIPSVKWHWHLTPSAFSPNRRPVPGDHTHRRHDWNRFVPTSQPHGCTHYLITVGPRDLSLGSTMCVLFDQESHETDLNCFLESICIANGLTDRCQFSAVLHSTTHRDPNVNLILFFSTTRRDFTFLSNYLSFKMYMLRVHPTFNTFECST